MASMVEEHRTTLVFVNTRRLVERVSHQLEARLGDGNVGAHHGSLSRKTRLAAEEGLKSGSLRVVVATASLELGIDVGHVDLVCHLGAPRSLSTLVQRIGRSGHWLGGIPKGVLFPLTRDERLVQSAAAVRMGAGRGARPGDHAGQAARHPRPADRGHRRHRQGVGGVSLGHGPPGLSVPGPHRQEFDEVVEMPSEGFATKRSLGAHLHRDQVNGVVSGRRGARLAAITSGGAIPDTADYDVIAEPEEIFVGTVNEDFAIESMAGDVFLLGNTSWRIRRVESGKVRVEAPRGRPRRCPSGSARPRRAPPSCPGRCRTSGRGSPHGCTTGRPPWPGSRRWPWWTRRGQPRSSTTSPRPSPSSASSRPSTPSSPSGSSTRRRHAARSAHAVRGPDQPGMGARAPEALLRQLRLRAAGHRHRRGRPVAREQHSFPLDSVFAFLRPQTLRDTLVQAVLPSPMFGNRWRWNATRGLALLRRTGGRKVPAPIIRMRSDDLMAAVFPTRLPARRTAAAHRAAGPSPRRRDHRQLPARGDGSRRPDRHR